MRLAVGELSIIVHGSTMAINSIVQEKGARIANWISPFRPKRSR
jgi:hypothetical protein